MSPRDERTVLGAGLLAAWALLSCSGCEPAPAAVAVAPPEPSARSHAGHEPGSEMPRRDWVEVRTSLIPGAGQGLFARVDIPARTYIGPYVGEYLTEAQVDALDDERSQYLFAVPACARLPQYTSVLGDREHFVSKANYAPKMINGRPTHLQNVDFTVHCKAPHGRLYTTRAVSAGEELYTDYGDEYDYFFMDLPEVQQHFLAVTGIPAQATFRWDYSSE